MNERIKQLAEEAKFMDSWFSESGDDCEKELRKFAELIINDCIDLVKPTSHHEAFAQGYIGGVDGLELLYSKLSLIRKHFGIKE